MVRTVQFNKPQTLKACVTAMALLASLQAPVPVAAKHTKADAKTMRLPSSSMRKENQRSTALAAKTTAVLPSMACSARAAMTWPKPSFRMSATPVAAACCSE